jgi:translation initiation factor 3 subunit G
VAVSRDYLPPRTESAPDADGVRTVVEYRRNAAGKVEKVRGHTRQQGTREQLQAVQCACPQRDRSRRSATAAAPPQYTELTTSFPTSLTPSLPQVTRRIRTVTKTSRVPLAVAERRRNWRAFGGAVGQGGEISKTSVDDIRIERPGVSVKSETDVLMEKTSLFTCRKCGGAHSTLKCPVAARMAELGMSGPVPAGMGSAGGPGGSDAFMGGGGGGGMGGGMDGAAGSGGKYMPPGARRAAAGGGGGDASAEVPEEELRSLRVSSLSTDATEDDLRELFARFGRVERIYVARDRETGESRGFAFVTFMFHEDADKARKGLNGHRYDHLVLEVSWAKPSTRDAGGMGAMAGGHVSGYGKALPQNPQRN